MVSGLRYRAASLAGALLLTALAVEAANLSTIQEFATTWIPLLNRLSPSTLSGEPLLYSTATTLIVVTVALLPVFKPRPRRILNIAFITEKRVLLATFALATIGYFDYTYRLPRPTLILLSAILLATLPAWFVTIRRRPPTHTRGTILIGDDPGRMEEILNTTDLDIQGYVSPPIMQSQLATSDAAPTNPGCTGTRLDGLEHIGTFSRLEEVIRSRDVDTAILAFNQPDRDDFFGTLDTCYRHGVQAKAHRDHVDTVLTSAPQDDHGLVDIDLEPWDPQDVVFKRAFDIAFATTAILLTAPIATAIALAIKLEDGGPILYSHNRTTELGKTFQVHKFRSMVPDAESRTGAVISQEDAGGRDPRVTRTGSILRRTHLDEIPQLWSILTGHMSVVGPRPERPELDAGIEATVTHWPKRWFVKPGLTGLAQIYGATGHQPHEKIAYDLRYIRDRTLRMDLAIVIRQVWKVLTDTAEIITGKNEKEQKT